MSIYKFSAKSIEGEQISLEAYKGKVLLIVNTASKCGLKPQLAELEELYQKHKEKGLVILGFPSDQFGNQELENNSEIKSYCERNFGVSFQLFEKVDVNGENAHPLFNYLKRKTKGFLSSKIKWNFTKFLIDRDGKIIKRYAPTKKPSKIEPQLIKLL